MDETVYDRRNTVIQRHEHHDKQNPFFGIPDNAEDISHAMDGAADDLLQIRWNFTDVLRKRIFPFVIAAAGCAGWRTHHNCSPRFEILTF